MHFEITWLVEVVNSYWNSAYSLVKWLGVALALSEIKIDAGIVWFDRDMVCNIVKFKN